MSYALLTLVLLQGALPAAVVPACAQGTHAAGPVNRTTMYDPEYFPTPNRLIFQMIAPYRVKTDVGRYDDRALEGMTILDPSAGNGAILKVIANIHFPEDRPELHAIELNPDMQPALREHFTLVHDDFLTFQTDVSYDLILMNPPFSNADAHLEKAWNILQHGDIVCLLNAETLRNPHSKRRQWLLQLVEDHGSVEYLGPAFRDSQRPTDVDVAMVRLRKTDGQGGFDFWEDEWFQPEEKDFSFAEDGMADLPAVNDKIAALVHQYQLSQQAFVDYLKAHKRLTHYADPLIDGGTNDLVQEALKERTGKGCFNAFVTSLQRNAWESIFRRTKLHDLMSSGVRKDFEKMRKDQGGMPLTVANIHALLELLFTNRHTILQRCVEEAFDLMCRYHDGNKSHYEGWKSNHAHRVNRKVIIPDWAIRYDRQFDSWSTGYGESSWKWDDIDRACAMLEGKSLSSPSSLPQRQADSSGTRSYAQKLEGLPIYCIREAIQDRFSELGRHRGRYRHYVDNVCESEYFHIKFWKKGTVHLVFKSEALWQRFNQQAALGKKWLPNDPDHVPVPTPDPAETRYAKRLELDNAENRKLMLTA